MHVRTQHSCTETTLFTKSRKSNWIHWKRHRGGWRQPAKRIPPAAQDGDSSPERFKNSSAGILLHLFLQLKFPSAEEERTYTAVTLHL